MKKEWVKYLCDPTDGSELHVAQVSRCEDNRIVDGKLSSANGNIYNICDGIPVFLCPKMQSTESVSSFAYEWNEFGFLYAKSGWETDIVNPLVKSTKFFKDKIVVDAGAGSGAQSRWMAEAGANSYLSRAFRRHFHGCPKLN
jgi:uncharacterized protein YbaR (Trm112 family)